MYFPITLRKAKTVKLTQSEDEVVLYFIFLPHLHAFRVKFRSSVTIVLLFPETDTFIPCTIFKAVYKFPQSVGEPGYKENLEKQSL